MLLQIATLTRKRQSVTSVLVAYKCRRVHGLAMTTCPHDGKQSELSCLLSLQFRP